MSGTFLPGHSVYNALSTYLPASVCLSTYLYSSMLL